jgi:hypothetical protein
MEAITLHGYSTRMIADYCAHNRIRSPWTSCHDTLIYISIDLPWADYYVTFQPMGTRPTTRQQRTMA